MSTPLFDLGYAEFSFLEPKVILIHFTKDKDLDEATAIEILSIILKLTKGEPHALIYDFNKKNITIREITRKISGVRDERNSKMICRAFIATSLQNKLESRHYIQAGKPVAETQHFTSKPEALAWVKSKLKAYFEKTDLE